jgi:hypothetical protein
MTVTEAVALLDGQFYTVKEVNDIEISSACGADLMSDIMTLVKDKTLLLTGLVNIQVVRTAELMDIPAIIFIRSKVPSQEMIDLAEENSIVLAGTSLSMFEACGKLYEAGFISGKTIEDKTPQA